MQEHLIEIEQITRLLFKKKWILIGITVLFMGWGYMSASNLTTSYQSRVKVYIGDSENVMEGYMTNHAVSYYNFMTAFKQMIVIEDFLNETLTKHNIGLTAAQVSSQLKFSESDKYSPILEITYQNNNEKNAKKVLQALTDEFTEQAQKINSNAKVQVIDSVKVYPISPNKTKVVLIRATIGFVLSIGVIFVLDYLDDRIKNRETLEKLLPVPVLGQLPHLDVRED